ncbi:MAG: energy transducer TonB [Acidobacteria bacterium]|nr:energy transducer TonB [Acidobacteriota bacterium]
MKTSLAIFVVLLAALARVPHARTQGGAGHFSKEGLAFDYPAGWALADTGDAQMQRLMLTRPGGSNVIIVFAQREPIKNARQLSESRRGVTMPYVANVAHKLGLDHPPPPNEAQCVPVGGRPALGFRLTGNYEGEPTTAEVYTVVLGQRLLHLVHLRAEKDEAAGAAAWKTLLDTLKVDAPAQPSPEADKIEDIVAGGVLNGRAVRKPQPGYPALAKSARAQGTVAIQIVIDEKGNVTSAVGISGHPLLQPAGVEAARRAKFEPTTMCGQPIKVTGVITYNFVLM